jgi:hypothetical protein
LRGRRRITASVAFKSARAVILRSQGNRISNNLGYELGEEGVVECGAAKLFRQGSLGFVLSDKIERQVAKHGEIVGTVVEPVALLILTHADIEPPMQSVFDSPVAAGDRAETFGRQRGTQEIIGRLGGGLAAVLPYPFHLADRRKPWPAMDLLQPVDVGRHRGDPGFDPAMVAIDHGLGRLNLALRIIEEEPHVVMQALLVALERHGIAALLIDDLLSDGALAVERIDGDG